jgi:hypothetical protein
MSATTTHARPTHSASTRTDRTDACVYQDSKLRDLFVSVSASYCSIVQLLFFPLLLMLHLAARDKHSRMSFCNKVYLRANASWRRFEPWTFQTRRCTLTSWATQTKLWFKLFILIILIIVIQSIFHLFFFFFLFCLFVLCCVVVLCCVWVCCVALRCVVLCCVVLGVCVCARMHACMCALLWKPLFHFLLM